MRVPLYSYDGESALLSREWYIEVMLWTLMWCAIIIFYEFAICKWLYEFCLHKTKK